MNDFIKGISELTDILKALNEEVKTLKHQIEGIDINDNPLLDAKGVMAKTGWSLKTTQKAMQDPRMKTIWLSKGPQVTSKDLERYCGLNINRAIDPYWKED